MLRASPGWSLPGCPGGLSPQARDLLRASELKGPSQSLKSEEFPFSSPDTHPLILPPPPPPLRPRPLPEPHLQPGPAPESPSLPPSAQGPTLQEAPRSPPVSSSQTDRTHPPHTSPTTPTPRNGVPAIQLSEPGAGLTSSCPPIFQPLRVHNPVQYHSRPIPTLNLPSLPLLSHRSSTTGTEWSFYTCT